MAEAGRQDADDGVPIVVDAQLAAQDVGSAAKAAPPDRVAQHDDFGDAALLVGRTEQPSELRVRRVSHRGQAIRALAEALERRPVTA